MPTSYTEIITYLHGGLNTALDPSNIGDDQLQEALGMEYRPPRKGLFAVPGRNRFDPTANGAVAPAIVYGLVYSQFDVSATSMGGQRLVAFAGGSAFGASSIATTGVFGTIKHDLTALATATTMVGNANGVHYGNQWFYYNSADPSWALKISDFTVSAQHGLFAVSGTMSASATASAGSVNAVGTFDIWVSEMRIDSSTDIVKGDTEPVNLESAFNGTVKTITLSATAMAAAFTFPAGQNGTNGYSFRVYVTPSNGKYPYGFVYNTSTDLSTTPGFPYPVTANAGTVLNLVPVDSVLSAMWPYQVTQPPGGVGVSSNSPPPTPYCMTVFQDSLVAIDNTDRQIVKYSLPDKPHYWPSTYFIPFETEKQDKLTSLAVCNNALLVFSSWYGFRVDDLPRASDGDDIFISRSRVKEQFSRNHGCTSPSGTTVFDIYGSGQLCMFVCRDGLHITDGYKVDYACPDLDWFKEVDITQLSFARLINNPKRHRVEFYYYSLSPIQAGAGGAARLDFYYHPSMLRVQESGFPKLPMLGPTPVPGPAATIGILNNDWQVWTALDHLYLGSGSVWVENTGTDDFSLRDDGGTTNINKSWRTKDFYFAGQSGEFEIERAYLSQAQTTASGTYTVTAYSRTDDLGTYNSTGTVNQSLKGNQPIISLGQTRAQSISLRGNKDDGGAWQEANYVVWVVKDKQRLMSAKSNV